jgi:hypothetical protein
MERELAAEGQERAGRFSAGHEVARSGRLRAFDALVPAQRFFDVQLRPSTHSKRGIQRKEIRLRRLDIITNIAAQEKIILVHEPDRSESWRCLG